ncbi:hypothetical protein [Streptomonospora sediminis]
MPRTLAELVGRHMAMAGRLLEEDPERAYEHAAFARRKASRMGVVREAAGIAAYTVGKWQEALSDLRAARRMTGRDSILPLIADCERGLGRPERALEIARDPAGAKLEAAERIELRIVAAGARRDLGQPEAALVELQVPELKERRARPWIARLFYAYADALLEAGRRKDAREYFARASSVDREGMTDADERLAELEGVAIVDVGEDVVWTDAEDPFDASEEAEEPDEDEKKRIEGAVPPPVVKQERPAEDAGVLSSQVDEEPEQQPAQAAEVAEVAEPAETTESTAAPETAETVEESPESPESPASTELTDATESADTAESLQPADSTDPTGPGASNGTPEPGSDR